MSGEGGGGIEKCALMFLCLCSCVLNNPVEANRAKREGTENMEIYN